MKQRVPGKNYSLETKQLILDKRRARRKWQLTRHPADKTVFNNLSQQLKRLLNDIKNEGITSYLENLTDDKDTNYSLWKSTQIKHIRRPIINASPIKETNNAWVRSNQENADVHADHLEKVFQSYPRQTAEENLTSEDCGDDMPITSISPKEVWKTIKLLNSKKPLASI